MVGPVGNHEMGIRGDGDVRFFAGFGGTWEIARRAAAGSCLLPLDSESALSEANSQAMTTNSALEGAGPGGIKLGRTRFESELQVRPDDLDMYAHVHSSRYSDYVLAARFDQMERCYGMGMAKFAGLGLAWFVRTAHLDYKRPLLMGEWFLVRTWIQELYADGVRVDFEILKREKRKLACDGWFHYTLVSAQTGRAVTIPREIAERYAV